MTTHCMKIGARAEVRSLMACLRPAASRFPRRVERRTFWLRLALFVILPLAALSLHFITAPTTEPSHQFAQIQPAAGNMQAAIRIVLVNYRMSSTGPIHPGEWRAFGEPSSRCNSGACYEVEYDFSATEAQGRSRNLRCEWDVDLIQRTANSRDRQGNSACVPMGRAESVQ